MKTSRFITEILPSAFLDKDFSLKNLRDDVKKRYLYYHKLDTDRFPIFEYNTNRKNYESLKESFEEEFFTRRGISRTKNNLHIPSTNTLALLFTDNNYTPSQKILNTCRSYTKESSIKTSALLEDETLNSLSKPTPTNPPFIVGKPLLLVAIILLLGFVFYQLFMDKHERLYIDSPSTNTIVPRILPIEGTAENTNEVWVVVKSKSTNKYYVQQPIEVQNGRDWVGRVIIGSVSSEDVGQVFEIRAFINPVKTIKKGDELTAWPISEVSTESIEVIRGSKLTEE
ncbi:hypothetical protein VB796_04600 [Arcicella sp. LKC2W]|uniref:hypothetical protein n=1 Tax=Arcicella sp. LKC2W TaxID=2984198 RepID=UPI002B1F3DB6|nr:hypothetical protein [Arcicella sp. LKC2W]MEA5458302.1 hypothetical protein [Arcicella sp. LKC2W]